MRHTQGMYRLRAKLFSLIVGLLGAHTAYAQTTLESIALKHLSAQALIDKLAPNLQAGESASVAGAKSILLSADTQRLAQYRELIAQLDQAPRVWLLEVRHGVMSQLQREGAFEGDVTVASRGSSGVVMIGGATGPQAARVVSQSLQLQEGSKTSLALGNPQPLLLKTLQASERDSFDVVTSTVRIEAQSGLWVVPYSIDQEHLQLELAPRSYITGTEAEVPLHASTLLPIRPGTWITIAESDDPKQTATQHYVLQARLSLQ